MSKYKFFLISFGLYLGLSPIYWFPYIDPSYFTIVKYCLFIFICFFSILFSSRSGSGLVIRIPSRYVIFFSILVMFLMAFIPFLLGSNTNNINTLINLFQILLFLVASKTVIQLGKVFYVIKISLYVISFFVCLSVFLMLWRPLILNPINNELFLIDTAFGGLRTSWSPAIGLFIPLLLLFFSSIVVVFIYLFSQLLTGGRSGFFLSILTLLPLLYIERNL